MDNTINQTNVETNKKPKKKKGCLIALIIVASIIIALIVGIVIAFNVTKKKIMSYVPDVNVLSQENIELLHENGLISDDEYVQDWIAIKYEGKGEYTNAPYPEELLKEYGDNLSNETRARLLSILLLDNSIYEDALSASSSKEQDFRLTVDAYADDKVEDADDWRAIESCYMTPNKKFIIYYTTKGNSAVTYDMVVELGERMEIQSAKIAEWMDVEEDYRTYPIGSTIHKSYNKMEDLWDKEGYATKDVENCIPVYLLKTVPDTDSELAHYSYADIDLLTDAVLWLWPGSYEEEQNVPCICFPYIVVQPKALTTMDNAMALITHELVHHYDRLKYGDEERILEDGLANYLASVLSEDSLDIEYTPAWTESVIHYTEWNMFVGDEAYREAGGYIYQCLVESYINTYGKEKFLELYQTSGGSSVELESMHSDEEIDAIIRDYYTDLFSNDLSYNHQLRKDLASLGYESNDYDYSVLENFYQMNVETLAPTAANYYLLSHTEIKHTINNASDCILQYLIVDPSTKSYTEYGEIASSETWELMQNQYSDNQILVIYPKYKKSMKRITYEYIESEDYAEAAGAMGSTYFEFCPSDVNDAIYDILSVFYGDEAADEFEEQAEEMEQAMLKDGVNITKVKLKTCFSDDLEKADTIAKHTIKDVDHVITLPINKKNFEVLYSGMNDSMTDTIVLSVVMQLEDGTYQIVEVKADVIYYNPRKAGKGRSGRIEK